MWLGVGLGLCLAGAAGVSSVRAEGAQAAVPRVIPAVMAGAMAEALDMARQSAFRQAVAEAAGRDRDIAAFYREIGYAAVWTGDDPAHRARRAALLRALDDAALHGLPERRYGRAELVARMADIRSARERGQVEVALSRAYLAYARDVQSGVLAPGRVVSDIKRDVPRRPAEDLLAEITRGDPRAVLRALPPQTNAYRRLMKERLRLEEVIAQGGWGPAVPGGTLEPGDTGTAVIALRDRLVALGYLRRSATARFDGGIESALREAGLRDEVTELANTADGGITLRFDAVRFSRLAAWLSDQSGQWGYDLDAFTFERGAREDVVAADLRLVPAAR